MFLDTFALFHKNCTKLYLNYIQFDKYDDIYFKSIFRKLMLPKIKNDGEWAPNIINVD